jgi:hypothetical protein
VCSGMILELASPGDLSDGGGDLRQVEIERADVEAEPAEVGALGDLSLGSRSFLAVVI